MYQMTFQPFSFQLITAKLCQVSSNMPSSPDSSSDSSTGSPHNTYDGPNIEAENCLPGVVSYLNIYNFIALLLFLATMAQRP